MVSFREIANPQSSEDSGMYFGLDGPSMKGQYINPKTGHKINIKECLMMDNNWVASTTTGQLIDFKAIKDYVKWTPELEKSINKNKSNIPSSVSNIIETAPINNQVSTPTYHRPGPDLNSVRAMDPDIFGEPVERPAQNYDALLAGLKKEEQDADMLMIHKILDNHPAPTYKFSLIWNKCPEEQILTLKNTLGVPEDKIKDYYINRIVESLDLESVKSHASEWFDENFKNIGKKPVVDKVDAEQKTKRTIKKSNKSV